MSCASLPGNFISVKFGAEYRIHNNFQIMARGRIAVQIERAGRFQHAPQFDQSHRHHGEIGHHVVFAQGRAHGLEHDRGVGVRARQHVVERPFGAFVPVPGIAEGFDLRRRFFAGRRLEKHIVGSVGVKRRVEIDQIDAFIRDAVAQDVEIVAVKQLV